ncbi:MAG: MASE1 domain-containing protein [Deltaproteobacteria bacterium]|nr:MASE1 domain-containing protein [Deltaproteobacteria bacterium]
MCAHLRYMAQVLAVAVLYAVVGRLGLMLDAVGGFATLVWPPTGISLALLLTQGYRLWPGVWLGALVVNVWTGAPLPVAAGIATGNSLEAILGALALRRIPGFRPSLERLTDVVGLVVLAAGLSTMVSATVGVSSLFLGGVVPPSRFWVTWQAWWLGDVLGDLVVAPLLLTWRGGFTSRVRPHRLLEGLVLALLLAWTALYVSLDGLVPIATAPFQQPYVLAPLFIWAALSFQQRGAASATFLVSVISIWGTAVGHGPFPQGTLAERLMGLQVFMGMVATSFLLLAVVVSERNRALGESVRLLREAQKAVQTREDILAVVSHDLRNPLGAVSVTARQLSKIPEKMDPEKLRVRAELILRAAGRMERLIADLLDFSVIEAGQLTIQRQPCVAPDLVEEALRALQPLTAEKNIQLEAQVEANGAKVSGDRERIQQVFSNLVGNSIKFTPPEGRISIKAFVRGERVVFSVSDNGPGIPEQDLPRIFDRYFRSPSGERRGAGLGLFIAKGIVLAHGGRIWAESKLGAGSTFYFDLPLLGDGRIS